MSNSRITTKERNLLKGAIRRVFSRSELRKNAIAATRIVHHDAERPRVKKWCRCTDCLQPTAEYQMDCDHVDPIIPVTTSLEEMAWDEVVNRVFCDPSNLRGICKPCHKTKTKAENKARADRRRELKRKSGC